MCVTDLPGLRGRRVVPLLRGQGSLTGPLHHLLRDLDLQNRGDRGLRPQSFFRYFNLQPSGCTRVLRRLIRRHIVYGGHA